MFLRSLVSCYFVVAISAKALHGSQIESNQPLLQSKIEKGVNVQANGADINSELIINGRETIRSQSKLFRDDSVPSQQHNGIGIDMPNKKIIDPYSYMYLLDSYLQQYPYRVMVQLDALPDYILVPRQYLYGFTTGDYKLRDFNDYLSVVAKQPFTERFSPLIQTTQSQLSRENTILDESVIHSEHVLKTNKPISSHKVVGIKTAERPEFQTRQLWSTTDDKPLIEALKSEPVSKSDKFLNIDQHNDINTVENLNSMSAAGENVLHNDNSGSVNVVNNVLLKKDKTFINQPTERLGKSSRTARNVAKTTSSSKKSLTSDPLELLPSRSSVNILDHIEHEHNNVKSNIRPQNMVLEDPKITETIRPQNMVLEDPKITETIRPQNMVLEDPKITNKSNIRPQNMVLEDPKITESGVSTQEGTGLTLSSQHETKEISSHKYPPFREIFGGDSLYRPHRKFIRLFHTSQKQENLRNFKG